MDAPPVFLVLDTSTLTLSAALFRAERSVSGRLERLEEVAALTEGPPKKQSELLPGVLDALLRRAGVELAQLAGLGLGLGPGSFTGLRIGLSSLKALAYAARVPLAGASSLAAAAMEGPEGRPLYATAVARRGELYVGRYRREGHSVTALEPEDAMSPAELAARLQAESEGVVLGPAVEEYRAELERLGVAPERLLEVAPYPRAQALARLIAFPAAFDAKATFALEPQYVRASEAERNPKFPPLPGPVPGSRLKEEAE